MSTGHRVRDTPQPAAGRIRRVAALGSRKALASIRRYVSLAGGEVILEIERGVSNEIESALDSLARLKAKDAGSIQHLMVLRAADAFSSLEEMLAALESLHALGIRFVSMEEPWLASAGSVAPAGSGSLFPALGGRAAHFLDLSIKRLEAENSATTEQERQELIKAEVGKVVAQLLLLAPYAVAVGVVSQSVLNAALLDPDLLLRRLRDLVSGSNEVTGAVTGAIPDALRGLVFSAISSLVLLIFRGTSIGLRAEIGGTIFMGLVTLSIYGLTAGFGTGIVGSLVALPGLALALAITFEFSHMVLRITSSPSYGSIRSASPTGLAGRLRRLVIEFGERVHPTRSRAATAAFVAIPLFVVVASLGAAVTHGGWLFGPARIALFALAGWSAWACLATPSAVRIPLWSTLGWAVILLLLSAATVVTAMFAVFVLLLLAASAVELVLLHEPTPAGVKSTT